MHPGRFVPIGPFGSDEAGGFTELSVTAQGGRPSASKITRVRSSQPIMMAVQLSSETIDLQVSGAPTQTVLADIAWQAGRGGHIATVDVGKGNTFTVAAAEVLEVSVRITGTVASNPVRVNCTVAPATGLNPQPAQLTQRVGDLVATVNSSIFAIPQFAKGLHLLSLSDPININVAWSNILSPNFNSMYNTTYDGVNPMKVGSGAESLRFNSASNQTSVYMVWDLYL